MSWDFQGPDHRKPKKPSRNVGPIALKSLSRVERVGRDDAREWATLDQDALAQKRDREPANAFREGNFHK